MHRLRISSTFLALACSSLLLALVSVPAKADDGTYSSPAAEAFDDPGADGGSLKWRPADAPGDSSHVTDFGKDKSGYFGCAASDGVLAMTADGGSSWSSESVRDAFSPVAVQAPDRNHCWVASLTAVFATADGGKSWSKQLTIGGYARDLEIVKTATGYRGWAVGVGNSVDNMLFRSDDGVHWNRDGIPAIDAISDVTFTDDLHGWLLGGSRSTFKRSAFYTIDGGRTWLESSLKSCSATGPMFGAASALRAAGHGYGWSFAYGGGVARTADSGKSWTCDGAVSGYLTAASSFTSPKDGWIVADQGKIARTSDGGAHWTPVTSPTTASLRSVSFVDATHGWAAGTAAANPLVPTFITYGPKPKSNHPPKLDVQVTKDTSGIGGVDATVTFDLRKSSDPDGDHLKYVVDWGKNSEFTRGSLQADPKPSWTYMAGDYTAEVTISDGRGGTDSQKIALHIEKRTTAVNCHNDATRMKEDSPGTDIQLSCDGGAGPLTYAAVDPPDYASEFSIGTSSGFAHYRPKPGFSGHDTFTFKANDGASDSNIATVEVEVVPTPNMPPKCKDIPVVTDADQAVTIDLDCSDSDGDGLSLDIANGPEHAANQLVIDQSTHKVTYVPEHGFAGVDRVDHFTYRAHDGSEYSQAAIVTVKIENQPPTCENVAATTRSSEAVQIGLSCSDPDGDPLSVSVVDRPAHAKELVQDRATVTYASLADFVGSDSFTFVADDGELSSNLATAQIAVEQPPRKPLAAPSIPTPITTPADPDDAKLKVTSRRLKVKRGSIRLKVTCAGQRGRCQGGLRLAGKRGSTLTKSSSIDLSAGQTKTVRLRLVGRAARTVGKSRRGSKVTIQFRGGATASSRWVAMKRAIVVVASGRGVPI